jgi:hypothetical protein
MVILLIILDDKDLGKKMSRKILIIVFLLSYIIPFLGITLFYFFVPNYIHWLFPLISIISFLFSLEIKAELNKRPFIWELIRKSLKDKIVFSTTLIVFFVVALWHIEHRSLIMALLQITCAIVLSCVIFVSFATQDAKDNLKRSLSQKGCSLFKG